jgi:WD40 repeat protein
VILTAKFSPDDALIVTLSESSKARLWDGATGKAVAVLSGHSKAITHVVFSNKGSLLATVSADGTARLWETKTGQLLRTLEGHENTLVRSMFSADDTRLLTLTRATVRLWDTETAALLGEYQNRGGVLSPDGRHFVTRSRDDVSGVVELESGKEIAVLKGSSAVFSPNGEMLATIFNDYKSNTYVGLLWDARAWKPVTALKGHTSYVSKVVFGPRSARIVTTSDDHTARLWQADTGKLIAILEGHTAPVVRTVFNHDGKRVLTVTGQETHLPFDYTARLWDAETGEPLAVFDHDSDERKAIFSNDGERIYTIAGGAVHVWQAQAGVGAAVPRIYGKIVGTGKSKNGEILIVSSAPNNIAHILEQDTLQEIATLTGHRGEILSAGFSPNGKLAVTGSADRTARVWNAVTGDSVATLAGHDAAVTRAVFSPDGLYILTESEKKSARLWDERTGTEISRLNCIGSTEKFAVFSPDSKRIAGFCADEMLHFWDVKTGAETAQPIAGDWMAISPDLAHAVERLNNVEAALRDTMTGAVIKTLDHSNFWAFGAAKFSADGTFLMTETSGQLPEQSAAHIWDAKTGAEIEKFYCPEGVTMGDAAFGPRSEHIVTVCYDQTVRVHHIDTRQEVAIFPGEPRRVNTHDTGTDGRWIISASFKDRLVFWPVFPTVQGLVDYAKDILPQCLDESERKRFFLNPEPPEWCIDMGKWPYHLPESKARLEARDSPEKTPFTKDHVVHPGDDLQAIINRAGAGERILFKAGEYYVKLKGNRWVGLLIDKKKSLTLEAEGEVSIVASLGGTILVIQSSDDITIKGIYLVHDVERGICEGAVMKIRSSTNIRINNSILDGSGTHAVVIEDGTNIRVTGGQATYNTEGVFLISKSKNITVENVYIAENDNTGYDAMGVLNVSDSTDVFFRNNAIEKNRNAYFKNVVNSNNIVIEDNVFGDNAFDEGKDI